MKMAILVTELFWGKGSLPGGSLPVETVKKYRDKLCEVLVEGSSGRDLADTWPRYARVNSLCNNVHRFGWGL